jgi:hypothetical protein
MTPSTGYNPLYFAVSMTHKEHALQTEKGEYECLLKYLPTAFTDAFFRYRDEAERIAAAKQWFDDQVIEYRKRWLGL